MKDADQNPQVTCRDDPQEAQMAFFFGSSTIGKGPYKGIIENQEIRKVGLSEAHETEKLPLTKIDGKPTCGTSAARKIKTDMNEV